MHGLLLLTALLAPGADGAKVAIHNDSNQAWRIWFYVESKKGWSQPEMFLGRNSEDVVRLGEPGRYYLVLRDEAKRDNHIGWVNFHKLAERLPPGASLELSTVAETRTKEIVYTVYKDVAQTKTVIINGQAVERTYYVKVPEQMVKTQTMTVMVPRIGVRVGEKVFDLTEFQD